MGNGPFANRPQPPVVASTPAPDLVATDLSQRPKEIDKAIQLSARMANQIPKFKKGQDPMDYWGSFSQLVQSRMLNCVEFILVFQIGMSDQEETRRWAATYVSPTTVSDMVQLKNMFYQRFLDSNWKALKTKEICGIAFGKNEDVKGFCNRFEKLLYELDLDPYSTSPQADIYKEVLFSSLYRSLIHFMGNVTADNFLSMAHLIENIKNYNGVPFDYHSAPASKRPRTDTPTKEVPKTFCKYHGKEVSHPESNCFLNPANVEKRRNANFTSPKDKTVTTTAKPVFPTNKMVSIEELPDEGMMDDIINAIMNEDSDQENQVDSTITLSMAKIAGLKSPELKIPIIINGTRVYGVLDTGASHSFISPRFAKELKLDIQPSNSKVILADNSTVPHLGTTPPLLVESTNSSVLHSFQLLDMSSLVNCLIGRDLISKIGVGFTNLPLGFKELSLGADASKYRFQFYSRS
jgi:hypothetical protein